MYATGLPIIPKRLPSEQYSGLRLIKPPWGGVWVVLLTDVSNFNSLVECSRERHESSCRQIIQLNEKFVSFQTTTSAGICLIIGHQRRIRYRTGCQGRRSVFPYHHFSSSTLGIFAFIGDCSVRMWVVDVIQKHKRIISFENKCYRKILNIHWSEHRTNESIYNELKIHSGELLNFVKKQKLKYFGHVSRHDSLEKLILQGRVEGSRSRGRPRRKWTDDIQDWLSEDIGDVARMAEDRQLFRSRVGTATSRPG